MKTLSNAPIFGLIINQKKIFMIILSSRTILIFAKNGKIFMIILSLMKIRKKEAKTKKKPRQSRMKRIIKKKSKRTG